MVTASNTRQDGDVLRATRKALGMTRAQLAAAAECSIASLGFIEAGAVPRRSQVLDRAWRVLDALSEIEPGAEDPSSVKKADARSTTEEV
jgi:transcriptional regulator with XRE-family HTH domain